MKAEVKTITPKMAKNMLAATTWQNRPLNRSAIIRYANDMKAGNWALNGEPIILDDNANVIDGQHRLLAIIEADTTITSFVVNGIASEVFDTINIGRQRTGGDILGIAGYAHSKLLASTLRGIHFVKLNGFLNQEMGAGHKTHKRIDYLKILDEFPDAIESVKYIRCRSKKNAMFRPETFASVTHYLFGEIDKSCRNDFFDAIHDGISGSEARPILNLRRQMENRTLAKDLKYSQKLKYDYWIAAFQKFCDLKKPKPKLSKSQLLSFQL